MKKFLVLVVLLAIGIARNPFAGGKPLPLVELEHFGGGSSVDPCEKKQRCVVVYLAPW